MAKFDNASYRKEYRHQDYLSNKDKQRAQNRAWYSRNREERLAATKIYRANNLARERANQIKRVYGLSISEYNRMLEEQNNTCKLCKQPMAKPMIDHNHETKKVRGIVCCKCNWLIGYYEEIKRRALFDTLEQYLMATDTEGDNYE